MKSRFLVGLSVLAAAGAIGWLALRGGPAADPTERHADPTEGRTGAPSVASSERAAQDLASDPTIAPAGSESARDDAAATRPFDRAMQSIREAGQSVDPVPLDSPFSTSSKGLVEEDSPVPGGGRMVDLKGRFQHSMVATLAPDGILALRCDAPCCADGPARPDSTAKGGDRK